jgi:hypothetical protein
MVLFGICPVNTSCLVGNLWLVRRLVVEMIAAVNSCYQFCFGAPLLSLWSENGGGVMIMVATNYHSIRWFLKIMRSTYNTVLLESCDQLLF